MMPVCSEAYCDFCGDCIYCYGDDPCFPSPDGEHSYSVPVPEKDDEENDA